MAKNQVRLSIDGIEETSRAFKALGGKPLQRELGEVNKDIGRMIIDQAGGRRTGVGAGRGATIRPSAASREVMLRVGGRHRDSRKEQWGVEQKWPGGNPPERPNLIAAAVSIEDRISDEYGKAIDRILTERLPHFL